jgi:uncharacterized membrane protein
MSDNKVIVPLSILAVIGGYFLALKSHMAFSILLVLVTLTTYFGFLMLPGGFREETGFTESRIRLAIASTLTLTYLIYFCTVIFFSKGTAEEKFNQELLGTLTDLLKIVLPFYFGAAAVSEIVQKRSEPKDTSEKKKVK